jgi:hypothetical protein
VLRISVAASRDFFPLAASSRSASFLFQLGPPRVKAVHDVLRLFDQLARSL